MNKITKFFVGAIAALAIFGFAASASAAYVHTGLLKQGTTSSQVKVLQETLNANGFLVSTVGAGSPGMESMYFGSKTKAAVMAFQTAKGLKADGIVGAQTGTALAALTGGSVALPAGCSSTTGFSTTTGLPCTSSANFPAGCTSNSGYSTTTGQSCAGTVTLPAGCTSTAGYSSTTGAKCSDGSSSNNGPLSGGAGNITISNTSADTDNEISEGQSNAKVLAFRVEATGSDVSVSNVKVTIDTSSNSGSHRLERYINSASIWMGGNKVGSVNVSDFTKGSGDVYSANIAVSNAIVREGSNNKQTFYVALDANSTIDSADMSGDSTVVDVDGVRFSDATGVVLVDNTNVTATTLDFTNLASSGDVKVNYYQGSNNPVAGNVKVSDTGSTSDVLMLEFQVKAGSGSQVSFDQVVVSATATGATPAQVASELTLKRGSDQLADITPGSSNGNLTFDLDNEYVVNAGNTETFRVYAKVNKIDNNSFDQGDSMKVSLVSTNAMDKNGDSISDVNGSATGNNLAFFSEGVNVSNFKSSYSTSTNNGLVTKQTYSISFDATAFGNTYYIPKVTERGTLSNDDISGLGYVVENSAGTTVAASAVTSAASALSSSANTTNDYFELPDGQTKTFNLTVELSPTASTGVSGFYHVQLGDLLYDLDQTAVGTNEGIYNFAPAQDYQTQDSKID